MKTTKFVYPGLLLIALFSVTTSFLRISAQDTNAASSTPASAPVSTPVSAPGSATFMVKNGEFPWSDRVNAWQLSSVPASVDGNGPLPQQSCGSRMIVVPDGTKSLLLGVSNKDVDKFKIDFPDAQPTGDFISVCHSDGTGTIPYTVFKLVSPPASVTSKDLVAGLIILQINDKPAATPPPAPSAVK